MRRLLALIKKEFGQIRRDKRLLASLIVPPTIQILLFGFALNANVDHLRMGVVDLDHSPQSRDLIASMTESGAFRLANTYFSQDQLGQAMAHGDLDAGIVIPYDFTRDLERGRQPDVQILLNAMNANTAAIAQAYSVRLLQNWSEVYSQQGGLHAQYRPIAANDVSRQGHVLMRPAFLFNPGLVSSWFIVTGAFGVLLVLNGSIIASAALVKEREAGTVEQLLMTPSSTGEIIIAKITPVFLLLCVMILFAISLIKISFGVPFRGSFAMVLAGAMLCVLSGIGIGTFIATFTKSAQQAQLMAFFVNPPLASLSGALTPVEAMPHWMQPLTVLNPIRHFGIITRSVLLKGSGFTALWPHMLALVAFTTALLTLSVMRFRKQLG
jgi:ABC-2 type transport system permease protein